MRKIQLIGSLFMVIIGMNAQVTLTPDLFRRINNSSLHTIENYESYCTFQLINSRQYFENLFNTNAKVYNDFLPSNETQYLTPTEYCDILEREEKKCRMGTEIFQVCFLDSLQPKNEGQWGLTMSLKKNVYFRNWNNFRYPDKILTLMFYLTADTSIYKNLSCKIDSIKCLYPITSFSILNFDRIETDSVITLNDNDKTKIQLSDYEKDKTIFLPKIVNIQNAIQSNEYDVLYEITPDTSLIPDSNIFRLNIKDLKHYSNFTLKTNPFSAFSLKAGDETINGVLKTIDSHSSNLSVVYQMNERLLKKNSSRLYICYGIEYQLNGIVFTGDYSINYSSIDTDGDAYLRMIELKDIHEKIQLHEISIPVGLNYFFWYDNKNSLSFSWDTQIDFLLFKKTKVTANASYKGYYEQFDQVTFDRYYDYGYINMSEPIKKLDLKTFNVSMNARIGYNRIVSKRLIASANFYFNHSLTDYANYKQQYILSENTTDYKQLVYAYQSIKKNILGLELSLKYIF